MHTVTPTTPRAAVAGGGCATPAGSVSLACGLFQKLGRALLRLGLLGAFAGGSLRALGAAGASGGFWRVASAPSAVEGQAQPSRSRKTAPDKTGPLVRQQSSAGQTDAQKETARNEASNGAARSQAARANRKPRANAAPSPAPRLLVGGATRCPAVIVASTPHGNVRYAGFGVHKPWDRRGGVATKEAQVATGGTKAAKGRWRKGTGNRRGAWSNRKHPRLRATLGAGPFLDQAAGVGL